MKTKKLIALIAAAVITIGAITTGTIILLNPNKEPADAVSLDNLLQPVSSIPAHLLPPGYTAPSTHYIEFGAYPQTHVSNADLIADLDTSAAPTGHQYLINGSPTGEATQTWTAVLLPEYALNGERYVKVGTNHASGSYAMSSGTAANTNNIWFKVEPLLWFVTANNGTTLSLLAVNNVIAGIPFHDTGVTAYSTSGIRAFLNGSGTPAAASPAIAIAANRSFLQTAFNATAQSLITPTSLYNVYENNNNEHSSSGVTISDTATTDKIYLLSYKEIAAAPFNTNYDADSKRMVKPTDFALANYAGYDSDNDTGGWFLRTSYLSYSSYFSLYLVTGVGGNGGMIPLSIPSASSTALRPAMQVSISGLAAVGSADALTRNFEVYNYDLNGAPGTPPDGGTIRAGDTITLPPAPSRTGYTFSGWGVNNSATKNYDAGATVTITADTTIYAIWVPDYTIEYELGDGAWVDGYSPPTAYSIEDSVILPTALYLTHSGYYIFLRWHEDSINGDEVAVIPKGSTGNKTYYAEWSFNTVTAYDDLRAEMAAFQEQIAALINERNGLSAQLGDKIAEYDAQIDALNGKIIELEDEIKAHEHDYTNGYNDGKAEYIRDNGFVTWNILVGSDAAGDLSAYTPYSLPVQYNYGDEIIPPENVQPVQSQQYTYTFLYWSTSRQTNGALPVEVTFPRTHTGGEMYLYAVYERTVHTYDITWIVPTVTNGEFDYDVNTTEITATYTYNQSVVVPLAASIALTNIYGTGFNYLPNGWSSTQGGAKVTDFGKCTGARTFYARYILQPTV